MAQQHLVRVLVPQQDADALREELLRSGDLGVREVTVEQPDPGVYRDEHTDRWLHQLVKRGGARLLIGAVVGAIIGVLIVLAVPYLRQYFLPWTLILGLGGGAWAGATVLTARGVQVDKETDDLPDQVYEIDPAEATRERTLTITVGRDRNPVADLLEARGYVLLDSTDPKLDGRS